MSDLELAPVQNLPRVLTIAGSDSGGGAGIQADLKTFFALGCHGMSAITALTAQNTMGVTGIHAVPADFVAEQIDAVATDIGIDAAKTGMLASSDIIEAVADSIRANNIGNLVIDPVFVAKSRDWLLDKSAVETLKHRLFPLATLVTPNLFEAAGLTGSEEARGLRDMRMQAEEMVKIGAPAVLVKGGHLPGDLAVDLFFDGDEFVEVAGPRFETTDTHGTGCTLAAAIAASLAHGAPLRRAVEAGKEFVSGAIARGLRLGKGYGPVNPGWRDAP
ncbi:MAG TPA: bifunctional hydroxymethylpyrimidine kinase/phosphomethylpyrimidine kinase [Actinomycetota bacterium]|nr:bifunctional hydroxymethylpyrimidine kinase/phosphomethylpyrimidine kinase [Actinomycetota bacterium]